MTRITLALALFAVLAIPYAASILSAGAAAARAF